MKTPLNISLQTARQLIEEYIFEATHENHKNFQSRIDLTQYEQFLHLGCIRKFNEELGEEMLKNAPPLLSMWKEILSEEMLPFKNEIAIRLLFDDAIPSIKIGNLNAKYINHVVKFKGAISSFPEARVQTTATLKCPYCNNHLKSNKPMGKCYCCDKKLMFSEWDVSMETFQDLSFMEHIDDAGTSIHRAINIFHPKHEIPERNIVNPYTMIFNTMELVGIVHYNQEIKGFEVEILNARTVDDMVLTEDEIESAKQFIQQNQDNLHEIIRNHVCPHLYGMDNQIYITETAIIGCSGKYDRQLLNRNQQMFLLNVGKFGRGKSDISKSFIPYIPNAAIINTLSASSAGLKTGITKDLKGQYSLVMGTLPRCHNSFCVLEELDKTDDQANDYLQVISDGVVRLDKIIQFERKIHVNYIVNANPTQGDFDTRLKTFLQIDLPAPFIDRADVVVIPPPPFNEDTKDDFGDKVFGNTVMDSPFSNSLIKIVMVYLKKYTENPLILKDAQEEIKARWTQLQAQAKKKVDDDDSKQNFNYETRALISLIKFVKSWGRLHAYPTMDAERTKIALKILKEGAHDTLQDVGSIHDLANAVAYAKTVRIPKTIHEQKDYIIAKVSQHHNGIEDSRLLHECAQVSILTSTFNKILASLIVTGQIREHHVSGKTLYSLGVIEGHVATEYIEKKSCAHWIMELLERGELDEQDLVNCVEYPEQEIANTLQILKSNGDIYEPIVGKWKKML